MYINFSLAFEKRYKFLTWKENEINKQLDNPTEKVVKKLKTIDVLVNAAIQNKVVFFNPG